MCLFHKINILSIALVISVSCSEGQVPGTEHFRDGALRVDFILEGDHQHSTIILDEVSRQSAWSGNPVNQVDPFEYGEFKFHILHEKTGELIYSRGFCTLFEEWQTTAEAKTANRVFDQVILFPHPQEPVILEIFERNEQDEFQSKISIRIDPLSTSIKEPENHDYSFIKFLDNGDPATKLDIAFIAEGYTSADSLKFLGDATRLANEIINVEPYKGLKGNLNFWAIASISEETGSDLPGESIWKNTVMNSSFYTFGTERYLMTEDIKSVRDIAGIVPYDVICILVNTDKYGGGGIYNHYAILSSDNLYSGTVLVHELGHLLAGLGDEYYSSSVAYEDFYNINIEPWQPNLTTLVNFESKWKDMVSDTIPVPTPVEEKYKEVTGVFEGGGYLAKGIYRSGYDCRMKSNTADDFCAACTQAITEMVYYYCGQ